ncbi:hypothetical protein, partial [uncultured Roseobacter sp.]|uniref:hypothetical protein n=1 Tax=uncultured Roseobacter sp. TaxID=114847 RepID=UPI002623D80B
MAFDQRGNSVLREKRTDDEHSVSRAWLSPKTAWAIAANGKGVLVRGLVFDHLLYCAGAANDRFERPRRCTKAWQPTAASGRPHKCECQQTALRSYLCEVQHLELWADSVEKVARYCLLGPAIALISFGSWRL